MIERRRFPRYDCAFNVKYCTRGIAAIESTSTSSNISRMGIRLRVSRIIKIGDMLELDIDPADKKGSVTAIGRVVWTNSPNDVSRFEQDAGIEFKRVDPSEVERLLQPLY